MSKKANTSRKSRRIYTNKGRALICFGGGLYTPKSGDTAFSLDCPVNKVLFNEKKDNTVTVVQSVNRKKGVSETWERLEA